MLCLTKWWCVEVFLVKRYTSLQKLINLSQKHHQFSSNSLARYKWMPFQKMNKVKYTATSVMVWHSRFSGKIYPRVGYDLQCTVCSSEWWPQAPNIPNALKMALCLWTEPGLRITRNTLALTLLKSKYKNYFVVAIWEDYNCEW